MQLFQVLCPACPGFERPVFRAWVLSEAVYTVGTALDLNAGRLQAVM